MEIVHRHITIHALIKLQSPVYDTTLRSDESLNSLQGFDCARKKPIPFAFRGLTTESGQEKN